MHPWNFFFSPKGGRSSYIKNDTIAPLSPGCPEPRMDCLVMYLLSLRVLAYSSATSTIFP
nr:unnamed protein product [Callosobruchus chinensis]